MSEFYNSNSKRDKDGHTPRCRDCAKACALRWGQANRQRVRDRAAAWQAANPERARDSNFRKKYGITLAEYDALLATQGGVCAVCGGTDGARRLAVDHCHTTGRVRALLCQGCNTALGQLGEDPGRIRALATYIESI